MGLVAPAVKDVVERLDTIAHHQSLASLLVSRAERVSSMSLGDLQRGEWASGTRISRLQSSDSKGWHTTSSGAEQTYRIPETFTAVEATAQPAQVHGCEQF
jgi:hypothetical protein